jgi:hypothetical protein
MSAKGDVPHDDFRSGFIAGFQSIVGRTPGRSSRPGSTRHQSRHDRLSYGHTEGNRARVGATNRRLSELSA